MADQNSTSKLQCAGQAAPGQAADVRADIRADVRAGGWILALVIVGIWIAVGQLWRRGEPQRPITAAEYWVDINRANERDLLNLPEVGPTLAGNILSHRQQHGDFRSLSDVGDVPGVGPQTLKQLAPFLTFTPSRATAD